MKYAPDSEAGDVAHYQSPPQQLDWKEETLRALAVVTAAQIHIDKSPPSYCWHIPVVPSRCALNSVTGQCCRHEAGDPICSIVTVVAETDANPFPSQPRFYGLRTNLLEWKSP